MKCPYCSAENSDNATFCNLCLKQFQGGQTTVLTETKPMAPQTVPSVGKSSVNTINSGLIIKIALASLALVLLAVLVVKGGGIARDMVKGMMGMSGISTSEGGGIKIKQVIGGKMVEASIGKLPKGFPTDFPIYKGAKVKIGQSAIEQNSNATYMVIWLSESASKNIIDFYKTALPQSNYQITTPTGEGFEENGLLQFSKANATGKLVVTNKGSETNIMVSLVFNNE